MSLYWPWISKLSKSVGDRVLLMVICSTLLRAGGCGWFLCQWRSAPSGRREATVGTQRDRNP
ncbi:unnamed protein product, partial [Gulo gulo]